MLLKPPPLLLVGVLEEADLVRDRVEAVGCRRARTTGKRRTGDPVHLGRPRRQHVLPGQVVGGRGGEHLDLVALGQMLRHPAAVQLGPAHHLGAVALDDEAEPHAPGGPLLPPPVRRPATLGLERARTRFRSAVVLELQAHQLAHEVVAEVAQVEVDLGLPAMSRWSV